MIPTKLLKAIGKVLKHNGSHADHHLRNLMREIWRHLAQNPVEGDRDATNEKIQRSTVISDQADRLSSSSGEATTARSDQIEKIMSSSGNKTSSPAITESLNPPPDTARAKERVQRTHIGKGRYIEFEEEDDSTDSTGSDDSDSLLDDDCLTDSESIYMGNAARGKPTPLPRDAKRAERPHEVAGRGITGNYKQREHYRICLGEVTGGCWLTNSGHVLCSVCQLKPPALTFGSQRQCPHCGEALWKDSLIEEHSLKRYQRGCRISSRLAAQPMEEGQYAE